jgi:hypothetical protein
MRGDVSFSVIAGLVPAGTARRELSISAPSATKDMNALIGEQPRRPSTAMSKAEMTHHSHHRAASAMSLSGLGWRPAAIVTAIR